MDESLGELDGRSRQLNIGPQKYVILCYKSSNVLSASLYIDVTDGEKVWNYKLTSDNLTAQQRKLKIATQAGVLSIIKNAFDRRTCELSVSDSDELLLRFGPASSAASIVLPLSPVLNPAAVADFLDRLAGAAQLWHQRFVDERSTSAELRQQAAARHGLSDGGIGGRRAGPGAKSKPARVGMSVINPSSRKRKAAKGVVFEEDGEES